MQQFTGKKGEKCIINFQESVLNFEEHFLLQLVNTTVFCQSYYWLQQKMHAFSNCIKSTVKVCLKIRVKNDGQICNFWVKIVASF